MLVLDQEPSFTIYRLRFTDAHGVARDVAGVLGALEVVDAGAGGVLPHERTTPKDSTDRLELTRATQANLSPVWGLSLASGPRRPAGRAGRAGRAPGRRRRGTPRSSTCGSASPTRRGWRPIRDLLASDDVLIADGHHRYAVSRTYRDEVRAATGRTDTAAELTLAFVAELVADQLSVAPIHRLYSGVDLPTLRAALERFFVLTPVAGDGGTVSAVAATSMVLAHRRRGLAAGGAARRARRRARAGRGLARDGARRSGRAGGLPRRGRRRPRRRDQGRAVAAVLVRPPSLAEIQRTAREGLLMPPKSTFFTPKLKTGAVLRPLAL